MSNIKFNMDSVDKDKIVEYCIDNWFVPVATEMLNQENVETVVVAIAQYYNDEAIDAVHISFYPSSQEFTSWRDIFDGKINTFVKRNYISKYNDVCDKAISILFGDKYNGPYPDNNENFIEVFQKYCNHTYEDADVVDQYTPFIIFSKNEDGTVNVRNIGETIRLLK